jgi:hypothetical protein
LSRRSQAAAIALAVLAVLAMTHTAHGVECSYSGHLPCSFAGKSGVCEFSLDADEFLQRAGSCPERGGTLYLNSKRIKGLREDVFGNMGIE